MKRKGKKSGFFIRLFACLAIIVAIVFGVYFALDKLIVPKYFKEYGIHNMHDLVGMVKTLYNSPKEKDMITNGYTVADQKSGVNKLIEIGFPTVNAGNELDYLKIAEGADSSLFIPGDYEFTDREIAGILDEMLENEVLVNKLPNLNYIGTIKINVLEIIIEPKQDENGNYKTDSADVSFTFKFDTEAARSQMASVMDTPVFLLDMIVPKTLYITVEYEIQKSAEGTWSSANGFIGVNGRTVKESEILLNLLIKFIFPESDQMTIEKFSNECGNILIQGMEILGDIQVKAGVGSNKTNGIILTI